jgi:formylglycine-generating enzyme required for sulfatase activity
MRDARLRWRWLWVLLLLWPALALAEPRTALVVGNAGYRDSPLNNPVNDARDMSEALRALGFEVIQQENVDKRGFDAAVSDFARQLQQRGGVGLFYYSGHGAQVRGENYLIPVNATINSEADVEYEAVNAGRVLRNMEQAGNGLNIVVLDACRNNPYRGWYRSEGSKGLARMDAPTGSIIAYATAPGTVAADGAGRNSPYTAQLLPAMRAPGVGIEQLFKQVRIQVAKATDNRQVPWESSSLMGDFFFVPPTSPAEGNQPQAGQVFRDTLSDGTRGPAMVVIPAGEFQMGSPEGEAGRNSDERRHRVKIGQAFALGQYEVTVGEFKRFAEATSYRTDAEKNAGGKEGCLIAYREGSQSKYGYQAGYSWKNPNFKQGDDHPVVCVSWNDAVAYVKWLSKEMGQSYRLPTEAEWEYAARAGTTGARYWGDDPNQACRYASVADQTAKQTFLDLAIHECTDSYVYTAPVGAFQPNSWKLYDMLGNVWEWTCSVYSKDYDGPEQKCADKNTTDSLVVRGGSWNFDPVVVRSARRWDVPTPRYCFLGFRLARSL